MLFRRGQPFFYAFDLLWLDREDLRRLSLIERKARLRAVVPKQGAHILYLDHIEYKGVKLFESACALDLEGIVAKLNYSMYRATDKPSRDWIKVKNPAYSQDDGRQELFNPESKSRNLTR